jgi:uncharacterized damage-inducible protein DinB
MEIPTAESFTQYYEKLRERTLRVVSCIPPDEIEWTYATGKFTLGDILRHVAAIERYMYAENVQLKPNRYRGHGRELGVGYEGVLRFFNQAHKESMEIFRGLSNEDLRRQCVTPAGTGIPVWKWLRTLAEHEIHHRGQLYVYLGMLGIRTPALYGLTSEEVAARSQL